MNKWQNLSILSKRRIYEEISVGDQCIYHVDVCILL